LSPPNGGVSTTKDGNNTASTTPDKILQKASKENGTFSDQEEKESEQKHHRFVNYKNSKQTLF